MEWEYAPKQTFKAQNELENTLEESKWFSLGMFGFPLQKKGYY